MAAIDVTITGVLFDKVNRTAQPVVLIGEASYTGLGVGGGPVIPPGQPPGIWGPNDPRPTPPIHLGPGGDIGGPPVVGGGPIIPPPQLPPDMTPQPGDPTTALPPPAGSGGWPVQPITPPPYIVVNYPGVGPVVVAPPA